MGGDIIKKHKYKYLVNYGFTKRTESEYSSKGYFTESATGRSIVYLDYKIKTEADMFKTEKIVKDSLDIEDIETFYLYSFNRLRR